MALLIWRGPSQLDGQPILVALTGHDIPSVNSKTGPVLQTWVLTGSDDPATAVRKGTDSSICGQCPHRHHLNGGCYVLPWQAPQSIWRSVQNQTPMAPPQQDTPEYISHKATALRLGSYGDPMAVPVHVWTRLNQLLGGLPIVGYTHQWLDMGLDIGISDTDYEWYRRHLQASTEDDIGDRTAQGLGWSTFRIIPAGGKPPLSAKECPASTGTTCDQCMACGAGSNIYIRAHGARKGRIK